MNNSDNHREVWREISQQVKNHSQQQSGRQRVGLTPTDGNEAYKRSSTRSSRRSRSERTSYLMATGHLDIEESKHLVNQRPGAAQHSKTTTSPASVAAANDMIIYSPPPQAALPLNGQYGPSAGDQALREYAASRHPFANSHDANDAIFHHPSSKSSSHHTSPKSAGGDRFRQTYTEVRLPMKTSPAFEYILKDNKRRNKRCCLGLVYSTLIITCVAIIAFCSFVLVLRNMKG